MGVRAFYCFRALLFYKSTFKKLSSFWEARERGSNPLSTGKLVQGHSKPAPYLIPQKEVCEGPERMLVDEACKSGCGSSRGTAFSDLQPTRQSSPFLCHQTWPDSDPTQNSMSDGFVIQGEVKRKVTRINQLVLMASSQESCTSINTKGKRDKRGSGRQCLECSWISKRHNFYKRWEAHSTAGCQEGSAVMPFNSTNIY